MTDSRNTLTEMQDQIDRCRRLAIETRDEQTAQKMTRLADELERHLQGATFGRLVKR
jgi:hypothetical protein